MQKYSEYMNLQSIFMKINIFKITGTSTHCIPKLIKPLYSPDKCKYPLFILYPSIEYKTNFPNFVRRNINTYEK